ncbi:Syntaxin-22 [Vitis vinifera]|uniref:Syntaxin-22 n=1 Tax=Vitis vinifera TaxID=29760 RepID=A0A438CPE9_VITVI|nr:Syntaxin-22 [Vitis vinifera]
MSFEDLEWGRTRPGQSPLALATKRREEDDSSQAVAAGVFRINTAVSAFYRLVNSLGTPKDTLELREKLHKTRLHIGQLVKDTSAKLKQASENDQHTEVSVSADEFGVSSGSLAFDFSRKVADANLVALPSRSCLHHLTSLLSRKLLYLSCSMNSFWQARGLSMLSWIACLIAVFCYRNLISLFFRGFLFLPYKYVASKRIADAKLAKDFQAVLKEFQKAQRLAVERETAYTPFVPKEVLPSSYDARELEISSGKNLEQQAVLLESRRYECFSKVLYHSLDIFHEGTFKVNSYYRSLKEDNNPLFPEKEVWGSYAPLRNRFFAWEAVWGKISTIDMLMRKGWFMANRCNLCKENEETANHILIHCGKTRDLWNLLFSSFGVVWVLPDSVRNLLLEWKMKGMGKKRSVVWKMVPICLFWCIWGERNRRTFLEEEMTNTSLRKLFLRSLLEWSQQFVDLDLDYLSFRNLLGDRVVV